MTEQIRYTPERCDSCVREIKEALMYAELGALNEAREHLVNSLNMLRGD